VSAPRDAAPGDDGSSARAALLLVHIEPSGQPAARDDRYRTEQPCRALGELGHVSVVSGSMHSPALIESGLLDEADILVLCEASDPDLLPVIESRRRQQRLTAYEINSHLLSPPAESRTAPRARDLVARSLPQQLGRHADCLQLATPALDARFAALNSRRAVFPSQLWEAPPREPRPGRPGVVIGWGGSRAHVDDLRWVIPALRGVLERHPEVHLTVMGDPGLGEVLAVGEPGDADADVDVGLPPGRVTLVPAGTPSDYQAFLANVDIGLAPLLPTEFNRCRSDVRFLEYAAAGTLAVCSDLEPYRGVVRPGQTGFLFRDVAELETVLERALAEPELRGPVAARAALYATSERLERNRIGDRLAFYLAVATQLGLKMTPRPTLDETLFATAAETSRAFEGSRYFALGQAPIERLLAAGVACRGDGRVDEARRLFNDARRQAPRSYVPELLLGQTETDPILATEALERACELNPRSCEAAFLLGLHLQGLGAPDRAAAAFQRARAIAPTFGAPQEKLGELAEQAGRIEEACQLYEEAALQNSAFALPVVRLANAAAREGRMDKAVGLLERTLEGDPGLWLTNFVIGRAYLELRRFHQARVHLQQALDGADDRSAVLKEIAKAEVGLGNLEAARTALVEAKRLD
jgi:tetratricopeptide (TPR) repeat protein/glycosyltransferase involved in cell wall biosynthesis